MKLISRSTQCLTAVALILLALIIATQATPTALAAPSFTYTVNASFDAVDDNPGDGICATTAALGSACTLRAAVEEANLHAGADTINLSSTVYLLTIVGAEQANFPDVRVGDLDITDAAGVTINGAGAIVINTAVPSLFSDAYTFEIAEGGAALIRNLIIENSGQAYHNRGTLTLNNDTVRDGRSVTALGQTIGSSALLSEGHLTINTFTVSNMPLTQGNAFGGTITARGENKTISLNNVHVNNTGDNGLSVGGKGNTVTISNSSADGNHFSGLLITGSQVSIQRSTFSNNDLGGVQVFRLPNDTAPDIEIHNATISGNTGRGGLHFFTSSGVTIDTTLNNVTVTGNQGGSNGGSFAGGVTIPADVDFFAKNSIIAGNSSPVSSADCNGNLQSQGRNLIGNSTGCTISGTTAGNILNQAPGLAALADNGGATQTHALLAGSPALNAGNPNTPGSGGNTCEATDQLGSNRPLGSACDMGSVEGVPGTAVPPTLSSLSPNNATALGADFTLTLNGSGFNSSDIVRWKGQDRPTTFINANQLQADISATDLLLGEVVNVKVFDPLQGVASNGRNFIINNPVPVVTSLTPTNVGAGRRAVVTISGSNFTSDSQILMDGAPLETTFLNSNQVKATVPATATAPAGTFISLKVRNPAPGGGDSTTILLVSVPLFPPHVGIGSFAGSIDANALLGQLTLGWVHPDDWRFLDTMEVRLLDSNGNIVLWMGFVEEFGTQGALVTRDGEGRIASIGFPGETTRLSSPIGTVEMAESEIHAAPGTTIEVVYAVQFDTAVRGQTFAVEISANNNEANSSEGHGFEPAGTITIPSQLYLPFVTK